MTDSTFGIRCWGCHLSETHPWNGPGPEYDAAIKDMESRGWCQRTFAPGVTVWFCGQLCAYESYNAKRAEEIWDQKAREEFLRKEEEEFKKYCEETQIPKVYFAVFGLIVAIIAGLMWRGF